jgi:hypothetical protein
MSASTITANEAGLLFHRWITEALPLFIVFVSADQSMTTKLIGSVLEFTSKDLFISPTSPASKGHLRFSNVAASIFTYSEDTETWPDRYELARSLHVEMPNGSTLFLGEIRDKY